MSSKFSDCFERNSLPRAAGDIAIFGGVPAGSSSGFGANHAGATRRGCAAIGNDRSGKASAGARGIAHADATECCLRADLGDG